MGIFNSMINWLFPRYKLTIYHLQDIRVIYVRDFGKRTAKKITGKDVFGKWFEVQASEELNWVVEEIDTVTAKEQAIKSKR
jgi:hypothetical protein